MQAACSSRLMSSPTAIHCRSGQPRADLRAPARDNSSISSMTRASRSAWSKPVAMVVPRWMSSRSRVEERDVGGLVRHRRGLGLIDRCDGAVEREAKPPGLEAARRAAIEHEFRLFAGNGVASGGRPPTTSIESGAPSTRRAWTRR